jgi:hypothetical protein
MPQGVLQPEKLEGRDLVAGRKFDGLEFAPAGRQIEHEWSCWFDVR